MSYVTLYRKYRPQSFDEIIGQEHVTTTLVNAVDNDKVSHAYLFCGMRGTGKTTTARVLAKAVNCEKKPTSKPCGKCHNCVSITEGNSIDIFEIDAASNGGVNEIRDLREKVSFAPVNCRKKVYIIDEAHMLSPEASNAFLKMMEEPPEHLIFILATTEPHKILPTILSRCQRFDFKRIFNDLIIEHLKKIASAEKINIDEACLSLIAKQSQGSVRDAIGVLDQLGSHDSKISEEDVLSLLNIYEDDLLFDFADCIIKRDTAKALHMAQQVIEGGRDLRHFVNCFIEHFREIFLLKSTLEAEKMIAKSIQSIERLKEQAASMELWETLKAIDLLSGCSSEMRWSADTRLLFEIVLVKLTKLEADLSLEGLLYRLEEVEKKIESRVERVESSEKTEGLPRRSAPSSYAEALADKRNVDKGPASSKNADKEELDGNDNKKQPTTNNQQRTTESIQKIERLWPIILEQVKKQSIPIYSLVLQCHPCEITNSSIILEFNSTADFHMKEIEKETNLAIINKAVAQVIGKEFTVECILANGSKKQEAVQKVKPKAMSAEHAVKMVKDTFAAEVIEESSLNDPDDVSGQGREV